MRRTFGTRIASVTLVAARAMGAICRRGEFDVTNVLEPAPRKGDPRYDADREIFRAIRALLKTPRGAMATSDVDTSSRRR